MSSDGHGHGRMSGDGHSTSSRRERGISGDGGGEVFELDEVLGTREGAEDDVENEEEDEGGPSSSSSSSQRSSSPDSTHSNSNSPPSESSPPPRPDETRESNPQPEVYASASIPTTGIDDLSPPSLSHPLTHSTPIPTPLPSTTNSLSPTRRAHSRTPSSRSTLSSVFNDSTEGIGLSSSPPSLVVGLPSSAGSGGGGGGGGSTGAGAGGFSGSPVGGLWRRLRKGSMGVASGASGSNGGVAGAEDNGDADANVNGAAKGAKRRTGSFGLAVGGRVGLLGRRKGREREEEVVSS